MGKVGTAVRTSPEDFTMSAAGWIAAGLFALWALTRSDDAGAATVPAGDGVAPGPEPDRTAPTSPESEGAMSSAAEVYARYRDLVDRYGQGPIPRGAIVRIAWSESRGDPNAVARGNIPRGGREPRNAFVEGGILQERVAKSGDDYPSKFDFDPMSPAGAIWGRERSAEFERPRLDVLLRAAGFKPIADGTVADAIVAFAMPHSIGTGAFKRVLALAGPAAGRTLSDALRAWTERPESSNNDPAYGSQTGVKVRARVVKALQLPREAARIAPLPDRVLPLADRGPDVPPNRPGLYAAIKAELTRRGLAG